MESGYAYPERSVKLLLEGEAQPEGAMGDRDITAGFTEVSSGRSTCDPKQERARHQKCQGVPAELVALQGKQKTYWENRAVLREEGWKPEGINKR